MHDDDEDECDLKDVQYKQNSTSAPNWEILLHPIELSRLIKRYSLSDNFFLLFIIVHLAASVHLFLKTAIFTFYVGDNADLLQYFDSICYPHIFTRFKRPYIFNNLAFALSAQSLMFRLKSVIRLIRRSIINANEYIEFNLTQINLTLVTYFTWPADKWLEFFRYAWNHIKERKYNPQVRDKHQGFQRSIDEFGKLFSVKELTYNQNFIDFDSCFGNKFEAGPTTACGMFKSWYSCEPLMRLDVEYIAVLVFANVLCFWLILSTIVIIILLIMHLELRVSFESTEAFVQSFVLVDITLSSIIRCCEAIVLMLLQFPNHFDGAMVLLDSCILVARTRKVISCLQSCLNVSNDTSRDSVSNEDDIRPYNNRHKILGSKSRNLNKTITDQMMLCRLLHFEFTELRNEHTLYLNLLIIVCGFVGSYTISLMSQVEDLSEQGILFLCILSTSAPIIYQLVSCLFLERTVSCI